MRNASEEIKIHNEYDELSHNNVRAPTSRLEDLKVVGVLRMVMIIAGPRRKGKTQIHPHSLRRPFTLCDVIYVLSSLCGP